MEIINRFDGEYAFLNGFFTAPVNYMGFDYKCSESAFYAQKSISEAYRKRIGELDAYDAYNLSREVNLRKYWEDMKFTIMYNVTWCKFTQNDDLRDLLLETGDKFLIDVNSYEDRIYGISGGEGDNVRGFILMNIRGRLNYLQSNEIENVESIKKSPFYNALRLFGIDLEYTTEPYSRAIIDKFIEFYGCDELLLAILDLIDIEDDDDDWKEEIEYIEQIRDLTV